MKKQTLIIFSITFTVNENLQKVAANLTHYVKYESWKFCDKCLIVEPKKMLPTYGNQKLRHITSCICTKGRYFVPMVRVYFLLITNSKTVIYYTYMYTYILAYIYIYIYISLCIVIYIYMDIDIYYISINNYIPVYIYMYISMCKSKCTNTIYIYIYIYIYIAILRRYTYMYTFIYIYVYSYSC